VQQEMFNGIFVPKLRKAVCATMVCVLLASISSAQSGSAMLYSHDGVQLNGGAPPPAIAIFPGDLVQTDHSSIAHLAAEGFGVTIQTETVARFDGQSLILDHGTVAVDTAKAFSVRVGCLTIVPARMEATQYEVTDIDGKVFVIARKSDVNINRENRDRKFGEEKGGAERVSVREGEQQTEEDKCAAAAPSGQSATPGLKGPLINSPWVKRTSVASVVTLACWVLCRSDNPISPNAP